MNRNEQRQKNAQILKRREQISALYLKGKTQLEIANHLNISRQLVSHDLQILYKEWGKNIEININELKAKELRKLDALEAEYWELYERSKNEYIKTTTIANKKDSPKKIDTDEKTSAITIKKEQYNRIGNNFVLDSIARVIEQRCKLLGLEKININLSGEVDLNVRQFEKMSDEELEEFIRQNSN
jgi:hypothetical protein